MGVLRFRESGPQDRQILSERRVRFLCFILLILISLICLSRWGVRHRNPLGEALSFVLDPLQNAYSRWLQRSEARVMSWSRLIELQARSEQLKAENERLRQQLALLQNLDGENRRLRRLHGLSSHLPWEALPAEVIGKGGEPLQTILLNQGTLAGVAVNQPVVGSRGLVGRVLAVRSHACLVLRITDPNSAVGVFAAEVPDEASGEVVAGIVSGHATQGLVLEPRGGAALPTGYPVFTSSISTIYPAGLLVGHVAENLETGYSLQRRQRVRSAVDFERLREVLILTGLKREQALSLRAQAGALLAEPEPRPTP